MKCSNFLWVQRRHNCPPAASFANCVMTLYLFKVHLQTFLSVPTTQKCQILSCDTPVTSERYNKHIHLCKIITSLRSSYKPPRKPETRIFPFLYSLLVMYTRWYLKVSVILILKKDKKFLLKLSST